MLDAIEVNMEHRCACVCSCCHAFYSWMSPRVLLLVYVYGWNDLSSHITASPLLLTFKQRLKMHLFRMSYPGLTY